MPLIHIIISIEYVKIWFKNSVACEEICMNLFNATNRFAKEKCGWDRQKSDDILLPMIKEYSKKRVSCPSYTEC